MSDGDATSLGHHAPDCPARLGLVKGLRVLHVAPTALRAAHALDEPSVEPGPGIYVMAPAGLWPFDIGLDSKGRTSP